MMNKIESRAGDSDISQLLRPYKRRVESMTKAGSLSTSTTPVAAPAKARFEIKAPSFELPAHSDTSAKGSDSTTFGWRTPTEKIIKNKAQGAFDDLVAMLKADTKDSKDKRDTAAAVARTIAFLGELVVDLGDWLEKGGDGGSDGLSKIIDDDNDPQEGRHRLEEEPTPTTKPAPVDHTCMVCWNERKTCSGLCEIQS
jgi:hypothetical protein